jgi:hypothetical protein
MSAPPFSSPLYKEPIPPAHLDNAGKTPRLHLKSLKNQSLKHIPPPHSPIPAKNKTPHPRQISRCAQYPRFITIARISHSANQGTSSGNTVVLAQILQKKPDLPAPLIYARRN